jgi:enediyne polyketide synthase
MHSIQSCVPDATLLPVAVQRLVPYAAVTGDGQVTMCATERSHSGDTYVYDVDVYDGAGVLVERWTSLKLQAVRKQGGRGPWVAALLGPYLQRQILEVADVEPVAVVVEPDRRGGPDGQLAGRELTALALRRALGSGAVIRHRPDGRPEAEGAVVSSSHGAGVTFGLVGTGPLAGDVQAVPVRADTDWDALLGPQRGLADRLVADTGEPLALAATRVWTVIECVRKSGCSIIGRPAIDRYGPDGWAVFALGDLRILTFTTTLTNTDGDVVFAVLTGRRS